jgi:hypothetical protein
VCHDSSLTINDGRQRGVTATREEIGSQRGARTPAR